MYVPMTKFWPHEISFLKCSSTYKWRILVIYQSPLFIRSHAKETLRGSLHNDTLFLSRLDVMDYSLLVGIDEEAQELVVGIVGKSALLKSNFLIRTI